MKDGRKELMGPSTAQWMDSVTMVFGVLMEDVKDHVGDRSSWKKPTVAVWLIRVDVDLMAYSPSNNQYGREVSLRQQS